MIRHELCRPERDPAGRGFRVAAGGRGECLLLLRLDGTLRGIAGGPGNGSGLLDWASGERGEDLEVGSVSGQWRRQVFVVLFSACGEGEGWRSGALERWMSGE